MVPSNSRTSGSAYMEGLLLLPEVLQSVDDVSRALQRVEEQMSIVLRNCTRGGLGELTTVECLMTLFALSKALSILFRLYLRGNGFLVEDHPVRTEVERVDLFEDKVQKAVDRSTGANRPASSLDVSAASRFIGHAISDLSEEQKRQILEVGKGMGVKRQHDQRPLMIFPRKRPSGLSLAEETAAFLAEAGMELMEKGPESSAVSQTSKAGAFHSLRQFCGYWHPGVQVSQGLSLIKLICRSSPWYYSTFGRPSLVVIG